MDFIGFNALRRPHTQAHQVGSPGSYMVGRQARQKPPAPQLSPGIFRLFPGLLLLHSFM